MKRVFLFLILSVIVVASSSILDDILTNELRFNISESVDDWISHYDEDSSPAQKYVALNSIYSICAYGQEGYEQAEQFFSERNDRLSKIFLFHLKLLKAENDKKILETLNVPGFFYITGPMPFDDYALIGEMILNGESIIGKDFDIKEEFIRNGSPVIRLSEILNEDSFAKARIRQNIYAPSSGDYEIEFSFNGGILIKVDGSVVYMNNILNEQGLCAYKMHLGLGKGVHSMEIFTGVEQDEWEVSFFFDRRLTFHKDEQARRLPSGKLNNFRVEDPSEWLGLEEEPDPIIKGLALRYAKCFNASERLDYKIFKGLSEEPECHPWVNYFLALLCEDPNEEFQTLKRLERASPDLYHYLTAKALAKGSYYILALEELKKTGTFNKLSSILMLDILSNLKYYGEQKIFLDKIKDRDYYDTLDDVIFEGIERNIPEEIMSKLSSLYEEHPYSRYDIMMAQLNLYNTWNDPAGAAEMLSRRVGVFPGMKHIRMAQLRALIRTGKEESLKLCFEEFRERFLYDTSFLKLLVDISMISGKNKSEEYLREIVRLDPQDLAAIELLSEITEEKDYAQSLMDKDRPDVKAAPVIPEEFKDHDLIELYQRTIVEIKSNNSATRHFENLFFINAPSAIEKMNAFPVYYNSASEYVKIDEILVTSPDGTMFSNKKFQISSTGGHDKILSDWKAYVLYFDNLQPGSKIYLRYRIMQFSKKSFKDKFPGLIEYLKETHPVIKKDFLIIRPKDKKVRFKVYLASEKPLEYADKGYEIAAWNFKNVPGIKSIPLMAPYPEVFPYLVITTFSDWGEVYSWAKGLFEERLRINAKLKDTYAGLGIKANEDFNSKLEKIFSFVAKDIHYLGIEYGLNGYQPRFPAKVIAEKYGDCKDKSTLMKVLLELAGIKSNITLVRTRDIGILETLPILTAFNHAILTVYDQKGNEYIVDPTANWNKALEVPESLYGAAAFEMTSSGPRLKTLNKNMGQNDKVTVDTTAEFEGFDLILKRKMRSSGMFAAEARALLSNRETAVEQLNARWNAVHQKTEVKDLYQQGTSEDDEINFSYSVRIFDFLNPKHLMFKPLLEDFSMYNDYASLDKISSRMLLPVKDNRDIRNMIVCPENASFEFDESALSVENKIFSAKIDLKKSGRDAILVYSFHVKKQEIEVQEYADFKRDIVKMRNFFEYEIKMVFK